MIEFFPFKRIIPFMKYGRLTTAISLLTFIAAVLALTFRGLNLGVDFTGGTVMEVSYQQAADLNGIRHTMEQMGLTEVAVQNFGTARDVMIRLPVKEGANAAQLSETVMQALRAAEPTVTLQRVEFVGPQVGRELYESGALALLVVCLGIMAYLAVRFKWRFALAAIIANMHDVVIILGFFAFFQWEFSLTVLAAILAILGYSVNESVVVFDRVRENFRKMRGAEVAEVFDSAITQTMSRTIITHTSTEIMVLAMLLLGGEALFYFALALTIGIVFGVYSSVLVASPVAMWLGANRADFVEPPKKEEAEAMV